MVSVRPTSVGQHLGRGPRLRFGWDRCQDPSPSWADRADHLGQYFGPTAKKALVQVEFALVSEKWTVVYGEVLIVHAKSDDLAVGDGHQRRA